MVVKELMLVTPAISVTLLPEIGARIHRLRAYGHDLLRTPADPATHADDPFFWGAYHMAPWCNRITAGPVQLGLRRLDLRPNFGDNWAIHGQVYARPWEEEDGGWLSVRVHDDGWPWPYQVGIRVVPVGAVVRIEQLLLNLADEPMPGGLGWHPWFRRPAEVAIRGDLVYTDNILSPPVPAEVTGAFDLRTPKPMSMDLDATWTSLADPPVLLRWPELGVSATLRSDCPTLHITAASPANAGYVAVEPQSHAPQGVRRLVNSEPGALTWLDPGATLRQTIEIAFEQLDRPPEK